MRVGAKRTDGESQARSYLASYLIDSPEQQIEEIPQGLKPSSLLALDGTTERRALPEPICEMASRLSSAER